MRILRDERIRAVLFAAALYVVVVSSPGWFIRPLTVVDGGNVVHAQVFRGTVEEALRQLDRPLNGGDRVTPTGDAPLRPGMHVTVERAVGAVVSVDGRHFALAHPADTVAQFLEAAGVVLGPLDRVEPGLDEPLTPGTVIRVVRVEQERFVRTREVPFGTKRWAEPKWVVGETGILREGKPGLEEQHMLLTYENGRLVQALVEGTEVLEEPVDEIVGVGTRILVHSMQTPAGLIRYTDVLNMEATAYYPGPESTGVWADGFTSTGLRAGHGVIAVDPRVIPLGTRLYVPGYGIAVAGDVGGAIKGNIVDLAFDTYREAMHFGRRQVKVYILAGVDP